MRYVVPALAGLLALFALAGSMVFTVDQRQNAMVFQFGELKDVVTKPGLHFKLPLIESARVFDRRLQVLAAEPERYAVVDATADPEVAALRSLTSFLAALRP